MRQTELKLLFDYNAWANARVIEACRGLAPGQLTEPVAVSFGTLLGTLVHILGSEVVWRTRLQSGVSPARMLAVDEVPDLAALEARWRAEEALLLGYIDSLSDANLEHRVLFTRLNGTLEKATLWKALAHLVFHGTQFRGEAGTILAAFGRSPGDLDFMGYLREVDQR